MYSYSASPHIALQGDSRFARFFEGIGTFGR